MIKGRQEKAYGRQGKAVSRLNSDLLGIQQLLTNSRLSLFSKLNNFFFMFIYLFIFCSRFSGILDQGSGVLVVFDETPVDKTYENTLELIHEMGKVVDALYSKAKKLQ